MQGHEPFVSYEGLEQLHRFLFVLGITHVLYSCLAVGLAMSKVSPHNFQFVDTHNAAIYFLFVASVCRSIAGADGKNRRGCQAMETSKVTNIGTLSMYKQMTEGKPSELVFFACFSCNNDGKSYVASSNLAYISLEQLYLIPIGLYFYYFLLNSKENQVDEATDNIYFPSHFSSMEQESNPKLDGNIST